MRNVTYAIPLMTQINFKNVCCNKMMILNITNKLDFTINEKDAYISVAMFIYMINVYLFKWVG